jgi:hypothetical protein
MKEMRGREGVHGERLLLADRRLPTFGTARSKPAGQDMGLNVSKVASNSSTGEPGLGQYRPLVIRSEFPLLAHLG